MIVSGEQGTAWWTFGGGVLNSAIASKLEERVGNVQYDNFAIHFKGQRSVEDMTENVRMLLEEGQDIAPPISEEVREEYKFGKCVPGPLLDTMIALRFSCVEQWNEVKRRTLKIIYMR
jgi:hypothetical protein